MPKIGKGKGSFTKKEQTRLDELETQCNNIVDELLRNPSNENLYRKLREVEIQIVQITKEKIIDY